MKIIYITGESLRTDPIISSQVIPLLDFIQDHCSSSLLTFESVDFEFNANELQSGIKINPLARRGHVVNFFVLIMWLLRNGRNYDVIHVRSYLPMAAAFLYKILNPKAKLIFDPRGLFAEEIEYYKGKSIAARIFKMLEWAFFQVSDVVIAVSNAMKNHFAEDYPGCVGKVIVIPTFAQLPVSYASVSVPDIRKQTDWNGCVLLCYSGSLEGWQCFDEILKLFSAFHSFSIKFRFVFLSKDAGKIHSKIRGSIPIDAYRVYSATASELPYYLAQCDFGFLVRKPHVINQVAAPIKVKDYLLAGMRIVVTSGVGDTSEFISTHDCGVTVEYNDVVNCKLDFKKFEKSVNASDRERISKLASKEFALNVAAQKHLIMYSSLLNGRGSKMTSHV